MSFAALADRITGGLCDDAALFPPGSLPLEEAVPAHVEHRGGPHRRMVGPFVVAASQLPALAPVVQDHRPGSFEVAVTVPSPAAVDRAMRSAGQVPALRVVAVEVAVPADVAAADVVPALDVALTGWPDVTVFVELPRDERRGALVAALSGTSYLAKLRTGGVEAHLYPDEDELASMLVDTARAGLPVKATAGLHHAVRNTDPGTGFEQHGFLNVIAAVDAALSGAGTEELAAVLAERNPDTVAARVRDIGSRVDRVREQFRSIGTCSIDEPVQELVELGLAPAPLLEGASR